MLAAILKIAHYERTKEWRSKHLAGALMLYSASSIFVAYLAFKQVLHPPTWNALFWIIQLFAAMNTISRAFLAESPGSQLFLYTLMDPRHLLLGKMLYGFWVMLLTSCLNLLLFSILIGNVVDNHLLFFLVMILGSAGFSAILTLVSAIAVKAGGNTGLAAILGFPLLLPHLILIIKLSKNAVDGIDWAFSNVWLLVSALLSALVVILGMALFPYLWRA